MAQPRWNYRPQLPIQVAPLFRTSLTIVDLIKWYILSWITPSVKLLIVSISIISWLYFHPSLEQTKTLGLDWIAPLFLRNLILMIVVAGGLHLYLHKFKKQGAKRQYDARPLATNKRVFTFNDQVLDNIFWTCASGVTVWTALESLMMWAMANGYAPQLYGTGSIGWTILLIFMIPIWESLYFYLIHRLLHWPPLYRAVHALHHRNTSVGPWSGLSMHPIEHVLFLGSVLIHFIIPANPLVLIYHLQYYTLSAATTHAGFEGIEIGDKIRLPLGTFHHQMHHRFYECNYGGLEFPFDKWFGSFHDGTEKSHSAFEKRRATLQR